MGKKEIDNLLLTFLLDDDLIENMYWYMKTKDIHLDYNKLVNAVSGENNAINEIIEAYSDCINHYCMSCKIHTNGKIEDIVNEDSKQDMIDKLKIEIQTFKL